MRRNRFSFSTSFRSPRTSGLKLLSVLRKSEWEEIDFGESHTQKKNEKKMELTIRIQSCVFSRLCACAIVIFFSLAIYALTVMDCLLFNYSTNMLSMLHTVFRA